MVNINWLPKIVADKLGEKRRWERWEEVKIGVDSFKEDVGKAFKIWDIFFNDNFPAELRPYRFGFAFDDRE